MQKQVETWRETELSNIAANKIVYEAFIEGELDVPKHLARCAHEFYVTATQRLPTAYDVEAGECLYLMASHNPAPKTARVGVRLSAGEQKDMLEAANARGYSSPSAFIRGAIRNELSGRSERMDSEQRISAGFDRIVQEIMRIGRGQQALFALVGALTKTVLT